MSDHSFPAGAGQPVRSVISSLKLTDFRNYESLSLETDARFVVLTGANGAGKTNILEAVSLNSPGRGLRRARYAMMARQGSDGGFSVFTGFDFDGDTLPVGTGLRHAEDSQRTVRIRGEPVKSADSLLEYSRILWLTPAMDGLFTGPAGDRRKFLDRLVLSVYPEHGRLSRALEQALRDRNRLLESPGPDPAWLDGVEAQIAEHGVGIAAARADLVSRLEPILSERGEHIPFPRPLLEFEGDLENRLRAGASASDVEIAYQEELRLSRRRDAAAGRTLTGPHRTDLLVTHMEKAMPAGLASTGEQKALLIGLMLAQTRLTRDLSGLTPVLLLDEVAAHLDPERRKALFGLLYALGAQTFMTGTDELLFKDVGDDALHYRISDGTAGPA